MYIGILSGTSCDGIDVALVDFKDGVQLKNTHFMPYPDDIKTQLNGIIESQDIKLSTYSQLDSKLGHIFAEAVNQLLLNNNISANEIIAIGSHGQTIYHDPNHQFANTIQIGSAAVLSQLTKIPVVAQFRQMDVAFGGQGAPLAPAFHKVLFSDFDGPIVILNLGGIANISFIGQTEFKGFDTGPANCLMDSWVYSNKGLTYDENGLWAQSGVCNEILLREMLQDPYFSLEAPKSTGREYFNSDWLSNKLKGKKVSAVDVQSTLAYLTAESVNLGIMQLSEKPEKIIVCGGGAQNQYLMYLLEKTCQIQTTSSESLGHDSNYIEAMLFAWLAKQKIENHEIDMKQITGATKPLLYGVLFQAHTRK